jgi:hypothetical protein
MSFFVSKEQELKVKQASNIPVEKQNDIWNAAKRKMEDNRKKFIQDYHQNQFQLVYQEQQNENNSKRAKYADLDKNYLYAIILIICSLIQRLQVFLLCQYHCSLVQLYNKN